MRFRPAVVAVALAFGAISARGALIDALLERVERSEFIFGSSDNNVPFPAIGWLNYRSYGPSEFNLHNGPVRFDENSLSQALLMPVWIGQRDMVMLGESVVWQQIDFQVPFHAQRQVTTAMPMVAWVRQTTPLSQLGTFLAPEFVDGGHYAGYALNDRTVYTGIFGTYWVSTRLAWVYGGVAMFGAGDDVIYPYVGALWNPTKEWSFALIAPWPTITYAPTKKFLLQFGVTPAGATLGASRNGEHLRLGYDSWNLLLSAHQQLNSFLWLSAGVGWSGFGSFNISSNGETTLENHLSRGAVWSLQLAVRPPSSSTPKERGWLPRP